MSGENNEIEEFLNNLPTDRRESMEKLRHILKENLPEGFEEAISSGMLHFVVPLSRYPDGYHVTPGQP